jgi:Ca2+-binding EF-hand superfamily protein
MNELSLQIFGVKQSKDERLHELEIDQQLQLEMESLFRRLDSDGNNHISEEELFVALSASSHNKRTRQEVKDIMKELDIDNDGQISQDEFNKFMQQRIKEDIITAEDEMDDIRTKFRQYDLNGNGWLSLSEI